MIKELSAEYWIEKLNLQPHPEGGFFREFYRSSIQLNSHSLPGFSEGDRNISTAIYYLLRSSDFSSFHRIKSDELWHYYDGSAIAVHIMDANGELTTRKVGKNPQQEEFPVMVVPKNTWFAAEVIEEHNFSLVGCTVAPGFDFSDFEMADRSALIREFPEHTELISRLTR